MASRFRSLGIVALPLFLAGIAVVWSLAGRDNGRANEASATRDFLFRSERILREIESDNALHLVAIDGRRLAGGGKAGDWLRVDGEAENGEYIGSILWERGTGALLQVIHRSPTAAAEGGGVTAAHGARQALFWLRRIGAFGKEARAVSVTPLPHTALRLGYRVRWQGGAADVVVFRRSGELASIDIDRSDQRKP